MGRKKKKSKKRRGKDPKQGSRNKAKKSRPEPFHNPFRAEAEKLEEAVKRPEPKKPPPPPPPPKPREEEIFEKAMRGVQPLGHEQDIVPRSRRAEVVEPKMTEEAEVLAQLADLVDGTGRFDISDTTEYIEGIAKGLDRRLLKRLRKGEFSIQGHLDLHGMTREEAKQAVSAFLTESRRTHRRCVLVICGRGHHSKDKQPVLKTHLAHWLVRGGLSRSVLAFSSARPCDGGAGAVYILLRK